MSVTATNEGWGTPRDDSLPHQIRFGVVHDPGIERPPGNLGVYVSCNCRSQVPGELEKALGGRAITDESDSRWLYNAHMLEVWQIELGEPEPVEYPPGIVHHGCCGCPKCNGGFAGPARHG